MSACLPSEVPIDVPVDVPIEVRAAGGVVWRRTGRSVEVLVIHRPKYDDWTLPKGKATSDESDEACAVRETEEETGLLCRLEAELSPVRYVDRRGRPKLVRYWLMQPVAGVARPQNEVDEVRWLTVTQARSLMTYDRDRSVLDEFRACVKHATAGRTA